MDDATPSLPHVHDSVVETALRRSRGAPPLEIGGVDGRTDELRVHSTSVSAEANEIFEQALGLSEAQRIELIDALTASLQKAEKGLSPEWTAEISRRISAVSRGESKLIPGDEVDARIQRALERA